MKLLLRIVALAVLANAVLAGSARSQYMYVDTNANGIHDPGDVLNATGPTTLDVWLDSNHNRDGSAAVCNVDSSQPLDPFSYEYVLTAQGGTITWGTPVNQIASFTVHFTLASSSTEIHDGFGGTSTISGAAPIKVSTLTATVASGSPNLIFSPTAATLPGGGGLLTSFGSLCPGSDFDGTYKLGSDWFDFDGVGPPVGGNHTPSITVASTDSGSENTPYTITASASDPDGGQQVTLSQTNNTGFLPTPSSNGPAAPPVSLTLSGTPSFSQSGTYTINWSATDNFAPPATATATTTLTIANVDRAPTVTAPATASGPENALLTFTVSALDPDGDVITSLTASGTATTAGGTFTAGAGNVTGTFNWTPTFTQAGSYGVTFTASNALSGTAATAITVNNVDRAPVVTAPASQTGAENSLLTFSVSASDPDGDAITNLTAAGTAITAGATFTKNAGNTSGTLSWTPTIGQAGGYSVTFTASNALSGTATTAITITSGDRPPVVTAPASASGNENTLISFGVTASDPDGQAITGLAAAPLPAGATFTTNGSFTSGTFSWTPTFTQAGSYSVTFTASNVLSGTAATAITVNNVDRAPAVTAPATASGGEGTLITFTVSASDPDGDAITSLTAAGTAISAGATFTAGAGNTSGTFSWTPTFTQAGSYGVTFTASNALSGTAATAITVTNVDRAPVVTAPATRSGAENSLLTFTVSASDPDGDALANLTAAPLPTGAAFTANGSFTSGTFSWTPDFTQAGSYPVTFTATNALSGTATTAITIANTDRAPVVTVPPTISGAEGSLLSFTASASDPDGDAITGFTAAPLPAGASFTAGAGNTSGTFAWTPDFTQAGGYSVTFTASNALSGTASTAITVANTDRPPVVTAPASVAGAENVLLTFTVSASDPDGDAIASLTGAPLPSGASFTANGSNTSGTFSWTPGTGSSGSYGLTFTASNALTGTASTAITISLDNPPVVTAPATAGGLENTLITFGVGASDPDAQAITSLTAAPLPTGATFSVNGSNTVGTFSWTPSFTQAGTYDVTFTASNALSGSATTHITVGNVDRPPVVTAPASETVNENVLLTFTVAASDPDAEPIGSLTAAPLPTGATFTADGANTSGTFSWTPDFTQAGAYSVTFTASNALSGSATTAITVTNVNRCPTITAPPTEATNEGVNLMFNVTATDPDGNHVTLTATGMPVGATFTDNGDNSGAFSWMPDFNAAAQSPYTVTFHGDDGAGCSTATAQTVITVNDVNRPPIAVISAPPQGVVNVPVAMNGSGSSDPDGNALTYDWAFGDGGTGTGVSVTHTYTSVAGSPYTISLTVTDNGTPPLSNTATQSITIVTCLPGTVFAVGGNKTTSLGSGKPQTCLQVQPATASTFDVNNVILSTITLKRTDIQSSPVISASGKTAVDGDKNGDGIMELSACFSKTDMRTLFAGLPAGVNTVAVEIDGNLVGGSQFCAPFTMTVKSNGAFLAATLSPNPFNPASVLTFATSKPGAVTVTMYDVNGRLVKSLMNESAASAGYHDVRIDGTSNDGSKLASGIYFVKIQTAADGELVMKAMIMK